MLSGLSEYFMTKNYVDTNPPKSWLDLFTIKQVKWSHRLGSAALDCLLKYGMMGTPLIETIVCVLQTLQRPTPWLSDLVLSSYVSHCTCMLQLPQRWVIHWPEAERSDHAVTSSCFGLCHRGSVSLLSTWRCSAPSYTAAVRRHVHG